MKQLESLDFSRNSISGEIPSSFAIMSSLNYLNMSYNNLTGRIPESTQLRGFNESSFIGYNLCGPQLKISCNIDGTSTAPTHKEDQDQERQDMFQGLHGKINPYLLNLKHLKYLDLSQNHFHQTIPSFIGSLTSLKYLNLSYAGFYGMIPHDIGNLSKLHTLVLEDSNSQGLNVDSLEWLSGLSKLEHLNMNHVNLSKAANNWAQVINKFPSLVELHFRSCSLNNFRALENDVNYNITSLVAILDLSDWLHTCKNLEFVDFSSNELSGKIPKEVTNLCKLRSLHLPYNDLVGGISDSFGNMSDCFLVALESLNLWVNQLSGHLTHQFGEFKSLQILDLRRNSLTGVIPNNLGNLSSLEYLNLGSNKLTGNLPESLGQLFNLKQLYVYDNVLEGVVTETHFALLSNLMELYASRNQLTLKVSPNWIPPFKLRRLQLRLWNLGSGSQILSWIETQKNSMNDLDLSSTGISGNVPNWFWNIRFLNISHNQLHGKIPVISDPEDGFSGWEKLVYLSSNKFSGSLPIIGNTVTELDLSNNLFSEDMSHFLCDTTNETYGLRILHLGGNHLTGELPDCLMRWPSLTMLNLGNNNLSGRIPDSIAFLTNLRSLNLYGNTFSGHIPFSMQNCTELLKIDLANNSFDGNIPTWMGTSLSNLRFLFLGSNKLGGEITSSICQLSSLQILDISDNKLSGIIPKCVDNFTTMDGIFASICLGRIGILFSHESISRERISHHQGK
ncbi:hypothetical protein DH2020_002975 [Rehmannia glutinosa]|uniref:Disease resistance R13L4/SHOC-2-like LRR domain-containing protein n=1 Tax=Rehmannia glutinosa TaxID=99300 RepID=A0ABR0XVJ8_REHGL